MIQYPFKHRLIMMLWLFVCGCQGPAYVPVNERTTPSEAQAQILEQGQPNDQRRTPAGSSPAAKGYTVDLNARRYQVQKNDTLYSIALLFERDFRDLARINNIAPPYTIYPGQTLQLTRNNPQNTPPKKPRTVTTTTRTANKASQNRSTPNRVTPNTITSSANNSRAKSPARPDSGVRWQWPTQGQIVGQFGSEKFKNQGIDIQGSQGQDIKASAGGEVVYAGNGLRGYGNLVIIKHNAVYLSAYAHNEQILVKEGMTIDSGQVIAKMGRDTAGQERLHFEIRRKGKPVDPLLFLPKNTR